MTDDRSRLMGMPADHFVLAIGVQLEMGHGEAGTVDGVVPIRPEMFVPATRRMRTGALMTMLDIVAGHVPAGAISPTVDLRLQVVGPVPEAGAVHLRGRPLRVGRRLVVGETSFTDDDGVEFARALSTFINQSVGTDMLLGVRTQASIPESSIDDLIAARPHGPMALEVDAGPRISNGPGGTVQGGVQCWLAEMAVEHALGNGRRLAAVDLDIRYLNPLTAGPLVATVEPVGRPTSDVLYARVALTDAGNAHRLVSHVALTAVPVV